MKDRLYQGPFPQYPPEQVLPGSEVVMATTPSREVVPGYGMGLVTYVTGDFGANTFRAPGLVAKSVITLDHSSGGRAVCGLGGAWHEGEHLAHGLEFGSGFGQRLDWLDESVSIIRRLFDGESVTHDGPHYRTRELVARPRPVQAHLPIMIGGSGEKKRSRNSGV